MPGFAFYFTQKPYLGHFPFAPDRVDRGPESFSGLLETQSAEKPQLYDLALTRIDSGQRCQRIIKPYQIRSGILRDNERFVERDTQCATAALLVLMSSRVIHKNAAHYPCRDREEVGAILPVDPSDIDQANVSLVKERRGLQCVIGTLVGHITVGESVQVRVQHLEQLVSVSYTH